MRLATLALSILALAPLRAEAVMLRYALVIGTNAGHDPERGALPALKFAEREAAELHGRLVERCHFDGGARTILLLGPTREEFTRAVDQLVRQAAQDRRTYGEIQTLFGFFFTGHGLSEQLLLADGPIGKGELLQLFERIDADLNVGVFDACFSGSVGTVDLAPKGVDPAPNIFTELPQEILSVEGSVWLASSGPNEISFEDRRLGGVFTHFFTEALDHAKPEGPAITLDQIWEYARAKTLDHTRSRGRPQTPRKVVTRLKAQGPLFFSYAAERSATLVLGNGVRGRFLVSYADGQLSEVIEKADVAEQSVRLYPGRARLIVTSGGGSTSEHELDLVPSARLMISRSDTDLPPKMGERHEDLIMKGSAADLRATLVEPGLSVLTALEYEFGSGPRGLLVPQHLVALMVRLGGDGVLAELGAGYGRGGERFVSWDYRSAAYLGIARAGYGWNIGTGNISITGGARAGYSEQRFSGGGHRGSFLLELELRVSGVLLLTRALGLEISGAFGPVLARGAGVNADYLVGPWGGFGAGLVYRAF